MDNKTHYDIYDSMGGIVKGGCYSGVFIELENGCKAFAHFGGLSAGTEVVCTLLKKPSNGKAATVSIDSVCREPYIAA